MGAHTVPFKSTQLKGVNATIVSVSNTAPGQNPTISFTLAQNDGIADHPRELRQQPQRPDGRPDDRLRDQPVP